MSEVIEVVGLDDLCDSLNKLAEKYPDRAGELLVINAKTLRKSVTKKVRERTKPKGKKKSLARVGSYKISKVQGYGADQYVEISATSPHFHLVERGHVQLNRKGEEIGFVKGEHMMADAIKEANDEMPETIEKMVDELLKEGGFI